MPLAVTHVLVPIIIADLIRDHVKGMKHKITLHELFVAGLFGLLPDIDILFGLVSNFLFGTFPTAFHRTYTHTLVIPAVIFLTSLLFWDKQKIRMLLWMAAFGWFSHIILDYFIIGEVMPVFPISNLQVGLNPFGVPNETTYLLVAGLDAVSLLGWLWHEERMKKIKDFY